MIEKRRSHRMPVQLHLSISDIYTQDHSGIHNLESPIEVINISSHGIGLISECILPLGYYFNADLTLGDERTEIHTVVKILRAEVVKENQYLYGCEFTNLSAEDMKSIEAYNQKCMI